MSTGDDRPESRSPGAAVDVTTDPSLRTTDLLQRARESLAPRYEVRQDLGAGGMAYVFRARDPRHERDVAIKVMRPELGLGEDAERFLREIRLTAQLQHPNIVAVFDSGAAGSIVYYVMPLVEGESLRSVLQREGRLSLDAARSFAGDIASALDYAHGRGIVHRDLKPENILLSSGRAMLADFGIAAVVAELAPEAARTAPGWIVGTPAYMSPEQCAPGRAIDRRSDVYALGCVVYEMLAGEPPFAGRTAQVVMARHVNEKVPSLDVLRPDLPRPVVRAVEQALAKVPADRHQTAGAFVAALRDVADRALWVRRWAVAGAAAAALGALVVASLTKEPAVDPNRVAIFPLAEGQLAADERGSGAAIAVLISTALEHADPVRPLDVSDRLTPEQQLNPQALSPEQRRRIARRAGAAHYINGVVQGHGDSITVGLGLYSVEGDSLVDQESASSDRSTPVHRLGIDAARALLPSLVDPGRQVDLSPLRNRRAGAVALFVQGERAYRHSSFPAAARFYRRALEEDSSLVIAAIKGALANYWQDHGAAAELATFAATRDSLLPPRYAAFARALRAFYAGDADSADAWLGRAIRAAPGWPEAEMQRGEVHHHLLPARGLPDSLAESQFRAAAADSGFSPPLIHLAEIAIRSNRLAEARDLIRRVRAMRPPEDLVAHLPMMLDCVSSGAPRYQWRNQVVSQLVAVAKAGKALSAAGSQVPCAEGAFRALLSFGPDTGNWQWGAVVGLMSVLAAQERTAEVVSLVDSVSRAGRLQVLMTAWVPLAAAGLDVDKQGEALAAFGQARWGPHYAGLAANRRLEWLQWLFGDWHARRGDREIVASLRGALARSNATRPHPITRLFERALDARLQLIAGDSGAAMRTLGSLRAQVPNDSLTWSMVMPLPSERLLLSQLLLARGAYGEAIQVASVFDHPEPMIYVAFLPASLEVRLRAAEALGRREAAGQYRERLARLKGAASAARAQ